MAQLTDILTLVEARVSLNMGTDPSVDTELAQVISAASQTLDNWIGAVVRRTVTDEEHVGGRDRVLLERIPVASITTVTEFASGTPTALTAETLTTAGTYSFDADSGILYRRNSWGAARFAGGIRVTYVAGRFANTASVEAAYKEAAQKILMHLWQTRGAQSGAATAGGDGAPFGAVPYSTATLRRHIMAMFTDEPVVA